MSHYTHLHGNYHPLEATYIKVIAFSSNIKLYTNHFRFNQGVSRYTLAPLSLSLAKLFTSIDLTLIEP
jgi:hypothetical protein